MALRYLLDTNIVSEVVRNPQGGVAERINSIGETSVCTSIVVAAELRFGARKSGSEKLTERVDLVLSALNVLSLQPPIDKHYAAIRHALKIQGAPIGPNDLLIAAHALALDLIIVTANTKEFRRVPALDVENWLQA